MFGATRSLILLTSSQLARIDYASQRGRLRVDGIYACPTLASGALAASVAVAFQLGSEKRIAAPPRNVSQSPWHWPARKRAVWILSSDFWNDTISLPLEITVMLQADELEQALALEAEHYSGISGLSSRIRAEKLVDASSNWSESRSEAEQWHVTQIASAELETLSRTVNMLGGNLLGIAHPSVVPGFAENIDLAQFGQLWAELVSATDVRHKLIQPVPKLKTNRRTLGLQAGAAAMAGLACAGLYYSKTQQLTALDKQCQTMTKLLADQQEEASRLQTLEGRLAVLRKDVAKAQATATSSSVPIAINRAAAAPSQTSYIDNAAWSHLLSALQVSTPDECWVERWESSDDHVTLHGQALDVDRIHELACALESALVELHWKITPPQTHLSDGSGLIEFEIALVYKSIQIESTPAVVVDSLNSQWLADLSSGSPP